MKRFQLELKWAFIFTLMGMLWVLGEKLAGLHDVYIEKHPVYTNFIAIPAIAVFAFALIEIRKKYYGGAITYGQAVKSGLMITLLVTLLSPLSQYLTSTFITPEFFKNAIAVAVRKGYSTQKDAEAYFNLRSYIIQGLIGAPIMGLITTLLVAAFIRKSNTL